MDISQPRGLILVHNYQPGKVQAMVLQWAYRPGEGGGVKGLQTPPHFKAKFERKNADFVKTVMSNVLRAWGCGLNQTLKSAVDWYGGILKKCNKNV